MDVNNGSQVAITAIGMILYDICSMSLNYWIEAKMSDVNDHIDRLYEHIDEIKSDISDIFFLLEQLENALNKTKDKE